MIWINYQPPHCLIMWINFNWPVTGGILYSDITDHCPAFLQFKQQSYNKPDLTKLSFRHHKPENLTDFSNKLSDIDWLSLWSGDVDKKVSFFVKCLNELNCNCFPLINKNVSVKRMMKPWLTPRILSLIKIKSLYFKFTNKA